MDDLEAEINPNNLPQFDFPDEFIVDEHAAEWRESMRKWAEQYGPQESL